MIFVPSLHTQRSTHHSRELSRRIEQVVRDYQRDNPDASPSDVQNALAQLMPGGLSPEVLRRKQALAVVIGALAVGAFTLMASTGGIGRANNNSMVFIIIGVVAALLGIPIAVIRIARRS